jgi:hypothetical protein
LELKFTDHFKQGKKIVSSKISKSLLQQKEERKKLNWHYYHRDSSLPKKQKELWNGQAPANYVLSDVQGKLGALP